MYSLFSIRDNIFRIFQNYIDLCIVYRISIDYKLLYANCNLLRNELGYYNSKTDLNQTESEN